MVRTAKKQLPVKTPVSGFMGKREVKTTEHGRIRCRIKPLIDAYFLFIDHNAP